MNSYDRKDTKKDTNIEQKVKQRISNLPVVNLDDATGRRAYAEMIYGKYSDSRISHKIPQRTYILLDGKATFVNLEKGVEYSISLKDYQDLTSGTPGNYNSKDAELIGIVVL